MVGKMLVLEKQWQNTNQITALAGRTTPKMKVHVVHTFHVASKISPRVSVMPYL